MDVTRKMTASDCSRFPELAEQFANSEGKPIEISADEALRIYNTK